MKTKKGDRNTFIARNMPDAFAECGICGRRNTGGF